MRAGNGDGTFGPATYLGAARTRVQAVATGAFAGAGLPDVVAGIPGDSSTRDYFTRLPNVAAPPPPTTDPDLSVTVDAAPATAVAGEPSEIRFTVRNDGGAVTAGTWIDEVFLSTDAAWSPDDVAVGGLTFSGGLAAGGSYSRTLTAPLVPRLPGDYQLIVRAWTPAATSPSRTRATTPRSPSSQSPCRCPRCPSVPASR